jgi:hypothetical protein
MSGGVALVLLTRSIGPGIRQGTVASVARLLIMSAYAFGVLMIADTRLDRSEPTTFQVRIEDVKVSSDKGHARRLLLTAWGGQSQSQWQTVPRDFYDSVHRGEVICIERRSGALGIAYFDVEKCGTG